MCACLCKSEFADDAGAPLGYFAPVRQTIIKGDKKPSEQLLFFHTENSHDALTATQRPFPSNLCKTKTCSPVRQQQQERRRRQPSPNWCLLIWSQLSERHPDKVQAASQRENNKGGRRADVRHGGAPHHKPVLPCHTLERYFRNSVRFLASCGGTGQSGEGRHVNADSNCRDVDRKSIHPKKSVKHDKHGSTQLQTQIWTQVAATPTRSRTSKHLWSPAGVLPQSESQCAVRSEPHDEGCRCAGRRPPRPGCRRETHRCPHTPGALQETVVAC